MSLHTLANHMAAQGRGPDTTLVHMAPTELASLQDLAQRHGGSLTINPHTGLPEAGFLSSLLPMALGAAAQFLPGMQGMGAGMIGAGIGAVHGLASGSLSQGLLAGMSAYSGAGLSGGLLGSGIAAENPAIQKQMEALQVAQAEATNKALTEAQRATAQQTADKLSQQLQQAQTAELNKEGRGFMDNLSTAGSGLKGGFKNFYTSMGTTPGTFGPKTTLAAGAIPMALNNSDQGQIPAVNSTDSDRGAYANSGATFHPNWVGPYNNKTPGGEKTYAMPYYGADGGLTHMADGGMADGGMPQHDAYQEYMDYLNKNLPSGGLAPITPFPFKYTEAPAALNTANVAALMPENVGPMGSRGSREKTEDKYVPLSPLASPEEGSLGFRFLDAYGKIPFLPGSMIAAGVAQNMLPGQITQAGVNAAKALRDAQFGYAHGNMFGKGNTGSINTFAGAGYGRPVAEGGFGVTSETGAGIPANPMSIDPARASGQTLSGGDGRDSGDGGDGGSSFGGVGAHAYAHGGGISDLYNLGSYSDGGRLLRGPGDGVSDSIPAVIGRKQPARLADGEFVVPARIVSEIGNGSTEAGARKLYAMMDRVQKARGNTMGKGKVAKNSRAERYLPA